MPAVYFWGTRLEEAPKGGVVKLGSVWIPPGEARTRLDEFLIQGDYSEIFQLGGRDFDYTPLKATVGTLGRYGLHTVKLERRDEPARAYAFIGPGHIATTLDAELKEIVPSIEFAFYPPGDLNWLPHVDPVRMRHGAD